MGCANSKQKRCSHCKAPYSPVPRSYSMHVHHPPQTKGDSYHVVALTSTTLGSLDSHIPNYQYQESHKIAQNGGNGFRLSSDSDSFRLGRNQEKNESLNLNSENMDKELINEAKTWSNMIEHKLAKAIAIAKTPITTPPGEPETIINTWELMEGLEDTSPFRSPNHIRFKSFSFDVNDHVDPPKSSFIDNDTASSKHVCLHMTEEEEEEESNEPAISDFDPEVISSFRKSLQELSPDSPLHLRPTPVDNEKQESMAIKGFSFEEKKINGDVVMDFKPTPCGKDKVVLYFTSLRGVRKTYEDCCHVRFVLKGLGVRVDERDVSMHSGFKEELKELLGHGFGRGGLPRVFVGRNYIGGAEEIQKLHEDGKLEKLFDCCEKIDDSGGSDSGKVCEACGDIRFVPCETCSGSCKIYYEGDDEEEEEEDGEVGEYGFQRCPDCNENGLIRCPMCCYYSSHFLVDI